MVEMNIQTADGKRHTQIITEETMNRILDRFEYSESIINFPFLTFHDNEKRKIYNIKNVTAITFEEKREARWKFEQ